MAYMKTDQHRIKELLSETIILLCKNGLHFDTEFSIEALIAITLDQRDIFLVSIKETVKADSTNEETKTAGTTSTVESSHVDGGQNPVSWRSSMMSVQMAKKRRYPATNTNERCMQKISFHADNTIYGRGPKTKRLEQSYSEIDKMVFTLHKTNNINESIIEQDSLQRINLNEANVRESLKEKDKEHTQASISSADASLTVAYQIDVASKDLVIVKDEPSSEADPSIDADQSASIAGHNMMLVPCINNDEAELCGDGFHGKLHNQVSTYSSWAFQRNSSGLEALEEPSSRRLLWHPGVPPPHLGSVGGSDINLDRVSCCLRPHPNLSPDELSTATAILTIPGAFINLGCVKAIRQKLRKVPKEVLVIVLESMSVLRDSPFFVGMLRCEGISRTFYKCPPSAIKQEALDYYQLDYAIYTDLYNGPIKVPNNIKDPLDWITKTKMTSPFIEQQQF